MKNRDAAPAAVKKNRILFAVIYILTIVVAFNVFLYFNLDSFMSAAKGAEPSGQDGRHYVVIAQNANLDYWDMLRAGALSAGSETGAAVEIFAPAVSNAYEEAEFFKMAAASNVDGIMTHVPDEEQFRTLIDGAVEKGIPVLTYDTDAGYSKRTSYLGVDNQEIGRLAGELVIETIGEVGNVVLIVQAQDGYQLDEREYRFVIGFNTYLSDYPELLLIREQYSTSSVISAESIANTLLDTYNSIDMIVCTNAVDAIGVSEAIKNRGRADNTSIICCSVNDRVIERIEQGGITAAIAVDYYRLGEIGIETLHNINRAAGTAGTDELVDVVTAGALGGYIEKNARRENSLGPRASGSDG